MIASARKKSAKRVHHRTLIGIDQRKKTRAHIIECAIHVFAAQGPQAPVIDDFIKAAGVSRGTFYNYFTTTHELLEAAIDVLSNDFIAAIDKVVSGMTNPIVRFATGARIYYDRAIADPAFGAFVSSIPRLGTLAEKQVREDLKEAKRLGLMQVTNIEVALSVVAGIVNFAVHLLSEKGPRALPRDEVIMAVLQGLGVKKELIEETLRVPLPRVTKLPKPFV